MAAAAHAYTDNPREAPGANNPPPVALADLLAERHAVALAEVDAVAARANGLPKAIKDEVALGRAGDVIKAARQLAGRLDGLRKGEVEPHLTAQRETNAFFSTFAERLKRIADTLGTKATDYQAEVEAAARRTRDAEAARQRAIEEEAREKARTAAEAGKVAAMGRHEDTADIAAERAERAEAAAGASTADLVRARSGTGTVVTSRATWDFEIKNATLVPLEMLRPYIPRADLEKFIRVYVKNNQDTVQLGGVRIFKTNKAAVR